nr:protein SGT1 homolog [Onthophagus taurus]
MGDTSTIKHDWYQTDSTVVITVLIKNVQKENLSINFGGKCVEICIKSEDAEHNLKYDLSHVIIPQQSSYKLTPSKIEIKLIKLDGIRWSKLEGEPEVVEAKMKVVEVEEGASSGPPRYPTSMKGKDWGAIEKSIKEQEKNEKPEGDEALNKLFQDLYSKGSDEVKMAMNKSFLESGGTVLSTNWDEIKKEKVPIKPPDGMEWKKWN